MLLHPPAVVELRDALLVSLGGLCHCLLISLGGQSTSPRRLGLGVHKTCLALLPGETAGEAIRGDEDEKKPGAAEGNGCWAD